MGSGKHCAERTFISFVCGATIDGTLWAVCSPFRPASLADSIRRWTIWRCA